VVDAAVSELPESVDSFFSGVDFAALPLEEPDE
jgi:hypothetical protein